MQNKSLKEASLNINVLSNVTDFTTGRGDADPAKIKKSATLHWRWECDTHGVWGGRRVEWRRKPLAPVVDTCSHPTALLQLYFFFSSPHYPETLLVFVWPTLSASPPHSSALADALQEAPWAAAAAATFITSEGRAPSFSSHQAVLQLSHSSTHSTWLMVIIALVHLPFHKICNQI